MIEDFICENCNKLVVHDYNSIKNHICEKGTRKISNIKMDKKELWGPCKLSELSKTFVWLENQVSESLVEMRAREEDDPEINMYISWELTNKESEK